MKEIFTSETFQLLSDRIDTFMEEHDVYDYDNVTIVVEKVKDETDPAGYIWKATLTPKDTANALQDLLVEEHEIIRHFWCKDDIRGVNGSMLTLTEEQVDAIARKMESVVDCEYGINWQFINDIAWEIAPEAFSLEDGDDEEDDNGIVRLRNIGKE